MMKALFSFCLIAMLTVSGAAQEPPASRYNNLGGWTGRSVPAKQFFYVDQIDRVWWLVDPGGKVFISKGVNHISYTADLSPALGYSPYQRTTQGKYPSQTDWAQTTAERLRKWGFNTIGAWSSGIMNQQKIPYAFILDIATRAGGNWEKGIFPDVFSKKFQQLARSIAQTRCKELKNDIYLLGYFTDNELRWGPDWRSKDSLLISYLKFEKDAPGFQKAVQFIQERYGTLQALNQAWSINAESFETIGGQKSFPENTERTRDEILFLEMIAHEYFRICREMILEFDPNHLILGCRFAGYAPEPVLKGLKDYVDVLSYNSYNPVPPVETLQKIHEITGRPILIGEFSFKAMDSGLPNTKGAAKPVATQAERAQGFNQYVTTLMKLPFVVGYHWFEYTDEPAEGRFDGENSNYGLVNIKDEPWEVLTQEMTHVNQSIEEVHAQSVSQGAEKP